MIRCIFRDPRWCIPFDFLIASDCTSQLSGIASISLVPVLYNIHPRSLYFSTDSFEYSETIKNVETRGNTTIRAYDVYKSSLGK